MSERTEYVAGLLFNCAGTRVALVRKQKPAWQAGRLNAVGGKIEPGETPLQAMHREFLEEAGVDRVPWWPVAVLSGPDFAVHFYAAFTDRLDEVRSMEAEVIETWGVTGALAEPTLIPNLRVIIPLALDDTGIAKPVVLEDVRKAA